MPARNTKIVSEASDFLVPATLRRGQLTIAVSTGAASPALAAEIRDGFARQFGAEYADYLALLGEARLKVMREIADPQARRRVLLALAKDSSLLDVLRRDGENRAKEHVETIVARAAASAAEKEEKSHLSG